MPVTQNRILTGVYSRRMRIAHDGKKADIVSFIK
jgi:hypothetical protein